MSMAQQYLKQVEKEVHCPRRMRSEFLAEVRPLVEEYCLDHPDATEQDFEAAFGAPSAFAETFLSQLEPKQRKRYARNRHRRQTACIAVLCVALIGSLISYAQLRKVKTEAVITVETVLTIYETGATKRIKSLDEMKFELPESEEQR